MAGITIQGIPQLQRELEALDGRDRQNAMRRGVRAAAKPFQAAYKSVAASSDVPRSFQKVPAARISTHGGASGRGVEARVRPKSPLFNIFEPGAGSHQIAPRRKPALSGKAGSGTWDREGRKRPGAFFSRRAVSHPGMRSRPLTPQAFARGVGPAEDLLANAIFGAKA